LLDEIGEHEELGAREGSLAQLGEGVDDIAATAAPRELVEGERRALRGCPGLEVLLHALELEDRLLRLLLLARRRADHAVDAGVPSEVDGADDHGREDEKGEG
jgi:hypothetical protein